jgi:hypothetical protein
LTANCLNSIITHGIHTDETAKTHQVRLADTKRKREAQAKHQEWLEANGLDDKTLRRSARDFKGL